MLEYRHIRRYCQAPCSIVEKSEFGRNCQKWRYKMKPSELTMKYFRFAPLKPRQRNPRKPAVYVSWRSVARMNRCIHQIEIRAFCQLFSPSSDRTKPFILPNLQRFKRMIEPPVTPETHRSCQHPIFQRIAKFPPGRTVRKLHGPIAGNRFSASFQFRHLLRQAPRCRKIVIIPNCNQITKRKFTARVTFSPDVEARPEDHRKMQRCRNITRAISHEKKFFPLVRLPVEVFDCFGNPFTPAFCATEAGYQRFTHL